MCTIEHMTHIASLSALHVANRSGWKSFLACNSLYPRLATLALCLLVLFSLPVHAESNLPSAPTPVAAPVFTATDWGISGALFATHVGDYLSTEQCIHGTRCREAVLPQFLVHRDGLFAAYEFSTASLEVYGAYRLTKMGHPKLARLAQVVNLSYTAKMVAHNYELTWHTPRPR
jgi:hypothetical protein